MRFISIYKHKNSGGTPPSPEHIAAMTKLIEEGMQAGWLIATEGVQWGGTALRVRRDGDKVSVVDGPFTEAKELLGGYALMNARSRDEVLALTRRFLDVAGDGECEIFQLFEMPADGAPGPERGREASNGATSAR